MCVHDIDVQPIGALDDGGLVGQPREVGGQSFIPEVLSKVRTVRKMVDSGELTILVEIDGGINADTIEQAAEAGVDCFVAGSAVYGAEDPAVAIEALRRRAGAASPHLRR